jgi:Xaa-Pro dipeptidase
MHTAILSQAKLSFHPDFNNVVALQSLLSRAIMAAVTTPSLPTDASATALLDRLRDALARRGLRQALLSHPESVAHLSGFSEPFEDWPVANPFVGGPALLAVTASGANLLLADFYAGHARDVRVAVQTYRSYDINVPPDPPGELDAAVQATGLVREPLGVEANSLPARMADALRRDGFELVPIDDLVLDSGRRKLPCEIAAIQRACELADVVQSAVAEHALAGVSELDLTAVAQSAMYHSAGRRVPAVLFVTAGAGTETGGAEPSNTKLQQGDIVLTDTSPWIDGAWSDTARVVVVGKPTTEQRRMFDALRTALDFAISLCRPGAVAGDIDRKVRESLADWGPVYKHHTGHGIGAAWSEEPRIVPYNNMQIEEDMVLAVEPAIYRPGFGGMRLEDVFVVRTNGNELLTHAEHRL